MQIELPVQRYMSTLRYVTTFSILRFLITYTCKSLRVIVPDRPTYLTKANELETVYLGNDLIRWRVPKWFHPKIMNARTVFSWFPVLRYKDELSSIRRCQ